jgi:hypothetical protein
MNGHWNAYCAYTSSGRRKDRAHSTAGFRKAFARIYLLLHGGTADFLNARLRRLGLPAVSHDFERNTLPDLRVIWNPQGYGSPNVPGNRAQAYYPGDRYVDVVGNDLYDIGGKAEWAANERLYRAHRPSPTRCPSGACGGSTTPPSSAEWAAGRERTGDWSCSRGTRARPGRSSISATSPEAEQRTAATSRRSARSQR